MKEIQRRFPCRKLIDKKVINGKVRKIYDESKSPYCRVMECPLISEKVKAKLRKERENLNPLSLRREIIEIKDRLRRLAKRRKKERA